jgi:ABC-type multidrug transport system ATPase subunit
MTAPLGSPPVPLVVSDVRKSYRSLTVLDGVSFTLEPGTVTVIGGINGIGKSTLLRCMAGLARFDGRIQLGDHSIHRTAGSDVRRLLSYLPQAPGLPETGTVAEILDLFARVRGVDLDTIPLPEDFLPPMDSRLRTLSGGQQQRVALSIALLGRPRVVLLDEPTANLDHAARASVWKAICQLTEQHSIVVIASPTPTEVDGVADRVIELDSGVVARDDLVHDDREVRP